MKHFKGFIALLTAAILFISTGFISGSAWGRQVAEAYPGAMSEQQTTGKESSTDASTQQRQKPSADAAPSPTGTTSSAKPSAPSESASTSSGSNGSGEQGAVRPRAAQHQGTWPCTWSLDANGVLHIGGYDGEQMNEGYLGGSYPNGGMSPWNDYANDIKGIVIEHSIRAPRRLSYMFFGLRNAQFIRAPKGWDWSQVEEIENICNNDASLTDITAFAVDTRNVRSFKYAFKHCEKLKDVSPLKNWYLEGMNNTDGNGLEGMFSECYSLENLDPLRQEPDGHGGYHWNMWYAKGFQFMFQRCYKLTNLDFLAGWNVRNVTNMSNMFEGCHSLADLTPLGQWGDMTKSLRYASSMFSMKKADSGAGTTTNEPDGGEIEDLTPLGSWNVGSLEHINGMFWYNDKLTDLGTANTGLGNWKLGRLQEMYNLFENCTSLSNLTALANWNTNTVYGMNAVFAGDGNIHDVTPVGKWHMGNVTSLSYMFANVNTANPVGQMSFAALADWRFGDGKLSSTNSYENVFQNVPNITEIGVPPVNQGGVELVSAYLNALDSTEWKQTFEWRNRDKDPGPYTGPFSLSTLESLMKGDAKWNFIDPAVYVRVAQAPGDLGLSVKRLIYKNEGTDSVPNGGNKTFGFTLTLRGSAGEPISGQFTVEEFRNNTPNNITTYRLEFDKEGKAQVYVRSFESDVITGLPAGAQYKITPLQPPAGYELTESTPSLTGTIPSKGRQTVSFIYTYFAQHAQVTVNLKKQLKGYTNSRPALQAGEFEFPYILCEVQRDNSCKQMQNGTATNAADGIIGLPTFEFAKRGTYRLEVRETKGSDRGIGYDTTTSTTTIEVSDNRNGHLTSTVNTDYGTFTNTVYKPAGLPETGRESHPGLIVAVAAAALFALVVALLPSKRPE